MNFHKFTILTYNEAQRNHEKHNMLINLDQIASIKPIKMTTDDRDVLDGYWIRLTNGKKYRALQIPASLQKYFEEALPEIKKSDDSTPTFSYQ